MNQVEILLERYPALAGMRKEILSAYQTLKTCFSSGGKLLLCGNGGSAADAEHIVGELMKEFHRKRRLPAEFTQKLDHLGSGALAQKLQGTLPALSLNSQTALMTAVTNDMDPALVFAQQVYGYGCSGDVLLALSTSGNSENVWNAAAVAKAKGMKVILISGKGGGKIRKLADVSICLPETDTYRVQELTMPVYHALCLMLEDAFFGNPSSAIQPPAGT